MDEAEGRDGEVPVQLLELDKALESLDATIGGMEQRLGSVLRRLAEKPGKDAEVKEEHMVPLAERIRAYRRAVEAQTARLRCMLSRLEL